MWRPIDRHRGALLVTGLTLAAGLTGCGLTGGDQDSEFCKVLKEQLPAYNADPLKAVAPDAGAGAWKTHFDLTHQRSQKLIDTAPGNLESAAMKLQAANDRMAAFFEEAQYDPGKIDSGALDQLLHDTSYTDAVTSVTAYAKDTCKIASTG